MYEKFFFLVFYYYKTSQLKKMGNNDDDICNKVINVCMYIFYNFITFLGKNVCYWLIDTYKVKYNRQSQQQKKMRKGQIVEAQFHQSFRIYFYYELQCEIVN